MTMHSPVLLTADKCRDVVPDVTIVMPCLNERISLPHCLDNARKALFLIHARHGLSGEVVVADNGSTDGSQALARQSGARVVDVTERGYGAALIGGCKGAYGRFILMGDADGSYDFTEGVAMIGRLLDGADLCMGSRFAGGIERGAMPWKNRHIGNPVLTGVLNLFFGAGIGDAHCGLRAITRVAFDSLQLTGSGMEFASEMVIKASLKGHRIDEVPATLSRDLRQRQPHLRPWRDGWRHLRYLFMLSPKWVFGIPGIAALGAGVLILALAIAEALAPGSFPQVGNYWTILGSALASLGYSACLLAVGTQLFGIRQQYRLPDPWMLRLGRWLTLERMLLAGMGIMLIGCLLLAWVFWSWTERSYAATYNVLPMVLSTSCLAVGLQTMMGGFLFSILGGHVSRFLPVGPE